MKNLLSFVLFLAFIIAMYGFAFASSPVSDPPGKKVFVDSKCQTCHSVTSLGLESKKKKDVSDLSDVGGKLKADFIEKYLQKKEKIEGKAHPSNFKGSEEDLKNLVSWLASLKKAK